MFHHFKEKNMLPKLKPQFSTVDEYIALQKDLQVRETLEQLRKTIIAAAPNADEIISYQMPAYRFHGILVWFAVAKNMNAAKARCASLWISHCPWI
jgi:uncharacterized protein YdhG (YjbR/CyaY superfamily)